MLILRDRSQVPGLSDDGRKGPVARSGQAGSAVRRKRRSCRRGAAGRIAKARQTDPHRARTQFRGAGPMAAVRPHWQARIVTRTGGDKALPWLRELGRRRPARGVGRLANRAVIGPRPDAPSVSILLLPAVSSCRYSRSVHSPISLHKRHLWQRRWNRSGWRSKRTRGSWRADARCSKRESGNRQLLRSKDRAC